MKRMRPDDDEGLEAETEAALAASLRKNRKALELLAKR